MSEAPISPAPIRRTSRRRLLWLLPALLIAVLTGWYIFTASHNNALPQLAAAPPADDETPPPKERRRHPAPELEGGLGWLNTDQSGQTQRPARQDRRPRLLDVLLHQLHSYAA